MMRRMSWPDDHSLKQFFTRVIKMVFLAEIIVLGMHFFDEPYRQHPWDSLARAIPRGLVFGLIFGTGRYFLDRRIAIEDRKPNML